MVTGRVQGVGFRAWVQGQAQSLGLRGWVRNRPDGAVEGLVCGDPPEALDHFRAGLGRGPAGARVDGLDWQPAGGGEEGLTVKFDIRR